MDIASLKINLGKLVTQRNIFVFFSVLLASAVVVLSSLLFMRKERIVILPTVGPSLWVEETNVSDTYLEKLGTYLGDLLLSRTPSDVQRKNLLILEHVHPSFYHEAKKQLSLEQETILSAQQTFLFRTTRSFIDSARLAYVLEGELLVFIGKVGDSPSCVQSDKKRFSLRFQCQRGKLLLTSLKQENL